jgi:hypothetical protein
MPSAPTYQQPFAPHGPYASTSRYAPQERFPGLAPTTVIPPVPAPPPPSARVSRRRSPMRRITLSAAVLIVGVVGILSAAGVWSPSPATYFAAALGVIGLGMFIGSFFGRVRGPITLGILLTLALGIAAVIGTIPRSIHGGDVSLRPTTVGAIPSGYDNDYGTTRLDLTGVKFTDGDHRTVTLTMNAGQVTVRVPANVDVHVVTHNTVGDVNLFGHDRNGVNNGSFEYTDDGADGPGGGQLDLNITVKVGDVEVRR